MFFEKFVVIYSDDIYVYSQSKEEHIGYLREVLAVLQENKLFVKMESATL